MALMRLCICGRKIDYSKKYCTECEKKVEHEKKEKVRQYDKKVRYSVDNIKYARFYNSTAWKRLSDYVKQKYNGLCIKCLLEKEEINNCDVVHHITEIKKDWSTRLQEDNLICLCESCHQFIHANYTEEKKKQLRELLQIHKQRYE